MTRPRAASDAFVAMLSETVRARLNPVFSPLIDIIPVQSDVDMGPQDSAIFSSRNGVMAGPKGAGRAAYCIGPATTKAALAKGWNARQVGHDADSLVEALQAMRPEGPIVHLSGMHTRGDITGRLAQTGLNIANIAVYDQILRPLSDEARQVILNASRVIVPLFSPRSATQFVQCAPTLHCVQAIALSTAVAREIPGDAVHSVIVTARPDAQAMGAALAEALGTT
ncbi:MAG: uroporphyrinogen-III synthase [Pseudomonadota bacterium]